MKERWKERSEKEITKERKRS